MLNENIHITSSVSFTDRTMTKNSHYVLIVALMVLLVAGAGFAGCNRYYSPADNPCCNRDHHPAGKHTCRHAGNRGRHTRKTSRSSTDPAGRHDNKPV